MPVFSRNQRQIAGTFDPPPPPMGDFAGWLPAGVALLLALVLAPETAHATNECGGASNGVATCTADTGDFDDGIRYFVSNAEGLTLTVEERTGGATRTITNPNTSSGNVVARNSIAVLGSHGSGKALRLVVHGDTNLNPLNPRGTNDGIRIRNGKGSSSREVTGSVMVDLGAEVDIGRDGRRFGWHGIHAIIEAGPANTTASNAGIGVINAGTIHAGNQGIRASGHGLKIANPAANHLNGRIEITHSGSISAGDWGIYAVSERNADVAVTVEGGGTVNGTMGIRAETKGAAGPGGSGDITITSAGAVTATSGRGIEAAVTSGTGTLGVTVNGGMVTATGGTGIHATSGTTVSATDITVAAGSSVTGDVHGIHANHAGSARVNVNVAGTVTGGDDAGEAAIKIEAAGPATVTLTDEFSVTGDILFDGAGDNDALALAVGQGMRGELAGEVVIANNAMVGRLVKNGRGEAWLGDDVTLSGSTVAIDDGVLVLRGHVDLGNDGTLTVAKGKRLMIEVGAGAGDHGKVTAGRITLAGGTPVYVSLDDDARMTAAGQLKEGITVFEGNAQAGMEGTAVAFFRYGSVTGNSVGASGRIMADLTEMDPEPKPEPGLPPGSDSGGSSSGGSGGGGAALLVVGGGALAYLLWDLGLFDGAMLLGGEGSDGQFGTLIRSFSSTPSGIQLNDKGIEYRVRLLDSATPAAAAILPTSGIATSLRTHLGDGFHADLTGTPSLSAGFDRDSVSGSRYGLGLGWRSGAFSTDIGYSHATLRARSTFSNLEGLGALSGQYGLRHDRVQANARLRLATAGLSLSPSLSLFEGAVAQDGFTASSRVWLSEVPATSRDYKGWKAGLSLAPRSPLKAMGLRWRPELRLMTAQLAGGGAGQTVIEQRDRTGALRLDTPAQASLPRTVHALGGGLTVAGGEDWALRGGYAALLADGALEHAAGAQLRMRF